MTRSGGGVRVRDGSRESRRCHIHGVRRVAVVLGGMGLVAGCVSSDVSGPSESGSSGPSPSGPTISNLVVLTGPNRALRFQMSATDPEGDVSGGRCLLRAFGITGNPSITVTPAVPPNPAAPLTVTCTLTVPSGLTGQR